MTKKIGIFVYMPVKKLFEIKGMFYHEDSKVLALTH